MRWGLPFVLVLLVMTAGCDGMPTDRPLFIVDRAAEVGGWSAHVHTVRGDTEVLTHSNWAHSVYVNLSATPGENASSLEVRLLGEDGDPLPFQPYAPEKARSPDVAAGETLQLVFVFQARETEHDGVSVHDVEALALVSGDETATIEMPDSPVPAPPVLENGTSA